VLLDRDGTINVEKGYVLDPDDLEPIPGAIEAMRDLTSLGLGLVVVTNQSPVGRGLLTPDRLERIHDCLRAILREGGVELLGIYVCPHRPEEGRDCRKPSPGLAIRAAGAHGFDLERAFVVGDHRSDVEMGRRVGATTILLRTGHGPQEIERGAAAFADHVVDDLRAAAGVIGKLVLEGATG